MEILKNRIYELIKECQQIRDKEYNDKNYIEFDQDTKVYNNNISLICGLNEARHIIKASEGNTTNSENTNCAIFDVIKMLPDSKNELSEFLQKTKEGRYLMRLILFPIANHFKTHPEKLTDLGIEIVGNFL